MNEIEVILVSCCCCLSIAALVGILIVLTEIDVLRGKLQHLMSQQRRIFRRLASK